MGEAALASTEQQYQPRNPQSSQYYQCVEDHFEAFEQVYDEQFSRRYGFFRPYVKEIIYRYLDCGDLHNGFARVRCPDCGHKYLPPLCWSAAEIPLQAGQTPSLLSFMPSKAGG